MSGYVGRLAPSPTGLLHVGHAATFWRAWERARTAGGRLLLRVEDLDRERSKGEYVKATLEDLDWLRITWDGEMVVQSERTAVYREVLERLLRMGLAYPCRCSRRELQQAASAPHEGEAQEDGDEPVYPGTCRPGLETPQIYEPGINYRFRAPLGELIGFTDGHLGARQYAVGEDFGDFLLWRKDGLPSYQLACVVDDAAMGVTEVVRGRDLLKSTARQMLVYRALGLEAPAWFHTELVRDAAGVRLAKRSDGLSIRALRERGMRAEEVLALAGVLPG